MKNSIKLILISVMFFSFNIKKTEIYSLIVFEVNTDSIKSKAEINELLEFGNGFKSLTKEDNTKYIELRNYTCNFELEKNPLIGFQRAKRIYDILEKECQISRTKIHYIDITNRELIQAMGNKTCDNMSKTKNVGIKLEIH